MPNGHTTASFNLSIHGLYQKRNVFKLQLIAVSEVQPRTNHKAMSKDGIIPTPVKLVV
jgi:hypothetical protein